MEITKAMIEKSMWLEVVTKKTVTQKPSTLKRCPLQRRVHLGKENLRMSEKYVLCTICGTQAPREHWNFLPRNSDRSSFVKDGTHDPS